MLKNMVSLKMRKNQQPYAPADSASGPFCPNLGWVILPNRRFVSEPFDKFFHNRE